MDKEEALKVSCDLLQNICSRGNELMDMRLFATIINAQADNDVETIVKLLDSLQDLVGKLKKILSE